MHSFMVNQLNYKATVDEYEKILSKCSPKQMADAVKQALGQTPFHLVPDYDLAKAIKKLEILFRHAKRLNLNPDAQFNPVHRLIPLHFTWNNTPLHAYLCSEVYDMIVPFLNLAKKYGFTIDLNLRDREGKTPLLFAIKLGNAPIAVIERLISQENYNLADNSGITPMMMASAMRRDDIAEKLHQCAAKYDARLHEFVNQTHPKSGKTLAHFAVMRMGHVNELDKEDTYQETVLNVLKSVAIDGRRDRYAEGNGVRAKPQFSIILKPDPSYPSQPVYAKFCFEEIKILNHALLSSVANAPLIDATKDMMTPDEYKYVSNQFTKFTGTSCAESILQNTSIMVKFLIRIEVDFSIAQNNNKTPESYVAGLRTATTSSHLVTEADKTHLFPLENELKSAAKKFTEKKRQFILTFFSALNSNQEVDLKKPKPEELILEYTCP